MILSSSESAAGIYFVELGVERKSPIASGFGVRVGPNKTFEAHHTHVYYVYQQ